MLATPFLMTNQLLTVVLVVTELKVVNLLLMANLLLAVLFVITEVAAYQLLAVLLVMSSPLNSFYCWIF